MVYFPDEVVENIIGFVKSHRDRNAVSLVCRTWYHIERLNRRSVFVSNCYAVHPERLHVRFPRIRSLSIKGKPHFADFDLIPAGWGAKADPWVESCARACPDMEELRLKRMVVSDECLKRVACSFANFKSLVLVSCEGFSTNGLATIATNCRVLSRTRKLEDLGTGSFVRGYNAGAFILDYIGDDGLRAVASSCLELQELRVFPANTRLEERTGVTEEGLVAVSLGCQKLISVLYFCGRMTNTALVTIAKNCPRLKSFRLCILEPRTSDAVTGQPLDDGFGAIVQSCRGLRRLSMSGLLTDNVFLYIGMYAEKLEMLSVAFAGDTDNGMIYVLNGCKNLKKLEIRDSPFGDAALLAGMERYEAICSLWMSSCNITLGACKSLATSMPNLNVEVMTEAAWSIDEADEEANNAKRVEKLYLYRTIAGPRDDVPGFVTVL
ncbi:hypothetical protein PR202_gb13521 [Eleusine coracana subsp. coracana]|uniref:F-box domain-containing protein n=1 Tax=Eleusine coracana subsp. coracana TaxID=191504 RepID=A0AAV5EQM2_ELECO|nr:hypothetical protein PR202_gb13521 [Eleusine coracana subsp. coracana]